MNTKPVCQLDHDGYFVGMTVADESPLEPGVWLMPARAVDVAAPEVPEGYRAKWSGVSFDLEEITAGPEPEQPAPLTLAERRAIRWEQIKARRSTVEGGGVRAQGHWFQTDLESQVKHQSNLIDARDILATGGSASDVLTIGGYPLMWKTTDNGQVPMTAGLAIEIAAAIKVMVATAYGNGERLRAIVDASEDPEQVDISAGWPSTYAVRNINTAPIDMLLEIQGIGPVTAQAIVDGRPWASVQDLVSISGVSQSMVDVLAFQLCT